LLTLVAAKISQQVCAMLGEEKKPSNCEEANQNKSASRSEKAAFRFRIPAYVIMKRHSTTSYQRSIV
jgi:hypothetical protein